MIFQVLASILMIIPLEIYNGFTKGDPSLTAITKALQNKDIAIALLYISRFLSGWSAGKSDRSFQKFPV
jgi:hypothetical protein